MKNLLAVGMFFIGSFDIVSCRTSTGSNTQTKSVDDIGSVTSTANGLVVVCKDGSIAKYTSDEFRTHVADNSICGGNGVEVNWMCSAANSFSSAVTRISDGATFGQAADNEICQTAIKSSRFGLICVPQNSFSSSIMLPNGNEPIGRGVDHKVCNDLISVANAEVVCVPDSSFSSVITRISDGQKLGRATSNDNCKKLAAGAKGGLVCAADNSFNAVVTRISDGKAMGAAIDYDKCLQSLPGR